MGRNAGESNPGHNPTRFSEALTFRSTGAEMSYESACGLTNHSKMGGPEGNRTPRWAAQPEIEASRTALTQGLSPGVFGQDSIIHPAWPPGPRRFTN
ncbi:hypothetical protein DFAR_3060040 [Desulfarculales bacterium]